MTEVLLFSVRPEHQEAVTAYMREMPDGEKFHCAACKISADTAAALWEECHKYQREMMTQATVQRPLSNRAPPKKTLHLI